MHPDWIEVEGNILSYETTWRTGSKTSGPRKAFATIKYQIKNNVKSSEKVESQAVINYSTKLWPTHADEEKAKLELVKKVDIFIETKNYKILLNPISSESKLFIPLDNFDLKSSSGWYLVVRIFKSLLAFALVTSAIFGIYIGISLLIMKVKGEL